MAFVPLNDDTPIDQYDSDAGQTIFPYTWLAFAETDIKVYVNGELKALTTDYTITAVDLEDGSDVVFNSGLNLNDKVTILREVSISRATGYTTSGSFRTETLNTEQNKELAISQQLSRDIQRCLRLTPFSTIAGSNLTLPEPENGKFLGWSGTEGSLTNYTATDFGATAVSSFMETFLDDGDAATALATLGVDGTLATQDIDELSSISPTLLDNIVFSDVSDSNTLVKTTFADALALKTMSNPNFILNGNMDIAQRGTSFVSPSNGDYTVDRFAYAFTGAGGVTITQDSTNPPSGSEFMLKTEVTTADATLAATDNYSHIYRIEGKDAAALKLGTADAEEMTLSFWVESSVPGTYHVAFKNSASDRSYPASFTIDAADTKEFKTITLTGDTAGTWLDSENTIGLSIQFTLAAGSNFEGTANSWQAGNILSASGAANVMGTLGNTFRVSQVKLELGDTATKFQQRPIGDELLRCQRYFQRIMGDNGQIFTDGYADTTGRYRASFDFVKKMKSPAISISSGSGLEVLKPGNSPTNATSVTFSEINSGFDRSGLQVNSSGTPFTVGVGGNIRFNGASQYVDIDAEF